MTNSNVSPVYPGTALRVGSSGSNVRLMQEYLNYLGKVYTGVATLATDGKYGSKTEDSVIQFQKQFSLSPDGVIGKNTWNAIVEVYNSVANARPDNVTTKYPSSMSVGSSGDQVRFLQSYLNTLKEKGGYSWPKLTIDGKYGNITKSAVAAFQAAYNLTPDGNAGTKTWEKLIPQFNYYIKTK